MSYVQRNKFEMSKLSFVISLNNIQNWAEVKSGLSGKYIPDTSIEDSLLAILIISEWFCRDTWIMTKTINLLRENKFYFFNETLLHHSDYHYLLKKNF